MTVTCSEIGTSGQRTWLGTLTDGVAVHTSLTRLAAQHQIEAGTVMLLGGLRTATLTNYDVAHNTRLSPRTVGGCEIVGGHGTLSHRDGAPYLHLHLVLAVTAAGSVSVDGGHVQSAVAHALEFVITAYDGVAVNRPPDPQSGLRLWRVA